MIHLQPCSHAHAGADWRDAVLSWFESCVGRPLSVRVSGLPASPLFPPDDVTNQVGPEWSGWPVSSAIVGRSHCAVALRVLRVVVVAAAMGVLLRTGQVPRGLGQDQ